MVVAIAFVHECLPLIGLRQVVGLPVGRCERPLLLGEGPLVGTQVSFVLTLQPKQCGQQGWLAVLDVGQERRDVLDARSNSRPR